MGTLRDQSICSRVPPKPGFPTNQLANTRLPPLSTELSLVGILPQPSFIPGKLLHTGRLDFKVCACVSLPVMVQLISFLQDLVLLYYLMSD
jgi:hypothetical protein